jgi:hypothetical protein
LWKGKKSRFIGFNKIEIFASKTKTKTKPKQNKTKVDCTEAELNCGC